VVFRKRAHHGDTEAAWECCAVGVIFVIRRVWIEIKKVKTHLWQHRPEVGHPDDLFPRTQEAAHIYQLRYVVGIVIREHQRLT